MMQDTDKIRILIVDDIPETRENLRKLLYFESDIEIVGTAANGREAIEQAQKLQPHITLMDINMPDMDGITASREIGRVAPACQVIMMSVQSEADYLRRSMLAGATDFLTKPFTSEELSSSIRRVYQMGASRRAAMPAAAPTAAPGAPAGAEAPARRERQGGKLLMIYSPKGGTGCSTVATNLAIALQQTTSKKIVLIDGSLQFGDLDVLLNLQAQRSIAEATAQVGEMDSMLLQALLSPHPSGIRVLTAPPAPEMAETIQTEDIKALFEFLFQEFDYLLLDTWSYLDDVVLAAMDLADRVLVVMTPEIPSIKSTKLFFEIAEALQFPLDRIDLILNMTLPREGIRAEQIEKSIRHPVLYQIPLEPRGMRLAVNQGVPLLMADPKHPLSAKFLELARQELSLLEPQPEAVAEDVSTVQPEERKRRPGGLFGRLKR